MIETHIISALRNKRSELDGALMQAEKLATRIRGDLDAIDRALKVFDPAIDLHAIRPIVRRPRTKFFAHGRFSRAVLDTLRRAEGPLTYRQIAERINAEHKLGAESVHAMRDLMQKVRSVLRPDRSGIKREATDQGIVLMVD
jgi:hypothetical protein